MTDYIRQKARKLKHWCETDDPIRMAKMLGIEVCFADDFDRLKGMYTVVKRRRFIFLNDRLPDKKKKIVCAHEIGHDQLHRALAVNKCLQEFMIYDMTGRPEYEANVFAAHLLLDDDRVMELARRGYDAEQIASAMGTDINLMLIKMDDMNREGYNFNLPYCPDSAFLGK